jgi:hypothetical protein
MIHAHWKVGSLLLRQVLMSDNVFAKEPQMVYDENYLVSHNERAEMLNGRLAMIGFVAAVVSYALTGKLVFGLV